MSVGQAVTAEQLWEMPEKPGVRYELVDGEVVEVPGTGGLHSLIAGSLYRMIHGHATENDLGVAFHDNTSYLLRRSPDLVRIPDVSFASWERIPVGGVPEGYLPFAPDLAVEIVSPNDRADDVHDKVREYLDAGIRMVLVLWPKHRSVSVHEPGLVACELGPEDELDGGDVLPGFRVRVGDLFDVPRRRR